MRTTLIAALIATTDLLLPCTQAQQSEADRQARAQIRTEVVGQSHGGRLVLPA